MEIQLQKPTTADFPFIEWLWGDPATTQILGGPFPFPKETRMDWLQSKSLKTNAYFIIKWNKQSVGEVSFRDLKDGVAHLNIKVGAKYRGYSIAKIALQEFLAYFVNECGGRVMLDEVRKKNVAAIQFLTKMGFEKKSEMEHTVLFRKDLV
ncbi:GNAT family N-acetyltransferase [Listeria sp. FSL L7-1517]|uniref:GNAT family N-acetyltransferase n=1 Tax=Listeria immobilis TaxID=2713502 RepID=UPI00164EC587|nr:N-acetyltransferase [Listeria immobilis]MBC6297867.1 GNAT family N-acetyltransferase [Listeria immobilis]